MSTRLDRTAEGMRRTHGVGKDGEQCRECSYLVLRPTSGNAHRHICLKSPEPAPNSRGEALRATWIKQWHSCALYLERQW